MAVVPRLLLRARQSFSMVHGDKAVDGKSIRTFVVVRILLLELHDVPISIRKCMQLKTRYLTAPEQSFLH
jgi:hypothetical protein